MKTVIVYSGKYGSTQRIAEMLKSKLGQNTDLIDLTSEKKPDISSYDRIIIGSGIYAGQIRRQVRTFCRKNLELLKTKNIAFFLCCMENKPDEISSYFKKNFPESLLTIAKAYRRFPGALVRQQKENFMVRSMFDTMEKTNKERNEPVEQWVQEFSDALS
jgi:menaquinone-dependent protoporphyrinogen oxidase